jgi:polyisoprenoid-binding protein YceI
MPSRISTLLAAAALAIASSVSLANSYSVDGVHSSVAFKILHNGVNHVYGTFAGATGSVEITDAGGKLEISVPTASVSTGNGNRDNHLKSNDYFAAGQFPTITFKSDKLTKNADGTYSAVGELTLRGVAKPLTVTLTVSEEKQGARGGTVRGVETSFTIKRSDFGITSGAPDVGDEVTLMVSLQTVKK